VSRLVCVTFEGGKPLPVKRLGATPNLTRFAIDRSGCEPIIQVTWGAADTRACRIGCPDAG